MSKHTTRRLVVQGVSSVPALALLSACSGQAQVAETPAAAAGNGGGGGSDAAGGGAGSDAGGCTLYPEQTQGPFFVDIALVRSDITEGKAGAPMTLIIEVLSAETCGPVEGALVDVWHCDADGVYSGFPGQLGGLDTTGQQFLRGAQSSDASGLVTFQTIYPGWYPGRTTHIHFKVRPTGDTEATSQLYFPEEVSDLVYATEPYAARGPKDTSNAADAIGRGTPLAVVTESAGVYQAKLTVTIA